MVAKDTVNQTPSSEEVKHAKNMAEEEKKEEEPIPYPAMETASPETSSMIESMPRQESPVVEDAAVVEEPTKRKSGLKAYLASLASRNKAKKEYLASLKEQNETKKKLLEKKKNGNQKVEAEPMVQGETVATDAVVVDAAPTEETPPTEDLVDKTEPTTGEDVSVVSEKTADSVKVETVPSEDSTARDEETSSSQHGGSSKENDDHSSSQYSNQQGDDDSKQQSGNTNKMETVEIVDSAELAKSMPPNVKEIVSSEELAKVDKLAQAHATWTCCAW